MPSDNPDTMTAIEISEPGGPEVLRPVALPIPKPGPGELLIRVAAAGVNRPDIAQRRGAYPPPEGASPLPGLEVAGEVAAVGPGVDGWTVGQPVCALLAGGGYAEWATAPAVQCLSIPQDLPVVEAAAVPETYFTVWTNLFESGRLTPGETVLVHGGASGIGTTAIQLASALGSRVFATAGSDERCRRCEELGAERAVNYRTEDFVEVVRDATRGRGVDVVLDMVGGDYVPRNLQLLAEEGRHVSISTLRGASVQLDIRHMMARRLTLTGSMLRPRSPAQKGAIGARLRREVWPLLAAGRVRPIIDRTFPLAEAAAAHRLMEAGGHFGKIVLVT